MERKRELLVTFRLDATLYKDEGGVSALAFARENAWNMIFKRAEWNVLQTLMHAAARPSGNETMDLLFRECLEKELEAIRSAALTATYEMVDAQD
jgi:hypothetical protein